MVRLSQDERGNYRARKRLPNDVREEYKRRFGKRREEKFYAAAKLGENKAKELFRNWESDVAAKIAAIRAERDGEGIALSRQQARALAGEWYHWFIARHPTSDVEK